MIIKWFKEYFPYNFNHVIKCDTLYLRRQKFMDLISKDQAQLN